MSDDNLDAADLAAALAAPGLVREDVAEQVYNLDEGIPTPFIDMVGGGTFKNLFFEWTENDLNLVDTDNAAVDGSDADGNDTKIGLRVGNRAQLSDKVVRISHASEGVDSVASVGRIAYQTARRMMDLRRDKEAIVTGRQGSAVDDGSAVPGRTGALGAWITSNTVFGVGGSAGGFNLATKAVDAPDEGVPVALAWQDVRDVILAVYSAGGASNGTLIAMSTPLVIRNMVSFLFSDLGAPFRAVPTANVSGSGPVNQTAQGWIDVVLSDFGITLRLLANRLQPTYTAGAADLFLLDPPHLAVASMSGMRIDELAKTGHADNRLISDTWGLKVFREDANGMIADIDPALPVIPEPV